MNRRKLLLDEYLVKQYFEQKRTKIDKSETMILTDLIKEIADGHYDDVLKQIPNKKRVQKNVLDINVEQAKTKANDLGYSKLTQLIETILEYEVNKERKTIK